MGRMFAESMLDIDIEMAISHHLQANHYPPVPLIMVDPCIDAIDAYWEESVERKIDLPKGVYWKGKTYAPAWAIIEQHHLESWTWEDGE